MSYGLPVLVSDIPANKEVELPAERYFRCGDIDDLKKKMEVLLEKGLSEEEREEIRRQIEVKYNPSTICRSYGAGWAPRCGIIDRHRFSQIRNYVVNV